VIVVSVALVGVVAAVKFNGRGATKAAKPPVTTKAPAVVKAPRAQVQSVTEAEEEPISAAPAVSATPSVDVAALVAADPGKFVDSLSLKEVRELDDLLLWRSSEQWRQREYRYNMLTDNALALLYSKDPALVPTPAQRAQIAELKKVYKPQMEAVLKDVWAQQDDLSKQLWDFNRNGSVTNNPHFRELQMGLMQEQVDLQNKTTRLSKPINKQYEASVKALLTPEQAKAYDEITGGN